MVDRIELKGSCAHPGIVEGFVCKVHLGDEDIQEDSVLVAKETDDRFLEQIKSAVAVITEEGGMLSHAARTAIEMHKPCIIGVKKAYHLLEDGMRVNVDAEHGIIRELGPLHY